MKNYTRPYKTKKSRENDRKHRKTQYNSPKLIAFLCVMFLLSVIVSNYSPVLSMYFDPRNLIQIYLVWLIASSITSFLFYGYDKFEAKRDGYRIPENLLHLLALSGGFLGCALGMVFFHHKTRKTIFKAIIALAFLIHGLIFLYLHTS